MAKSINPQGSDSLAFDSSIDIARESIQSQTQLLKEKRQDLKRFREVVEETSTDFEIPKQADLAPQTPLTKTPDSGGYRAIIRAFCKYVAPYQPLEIETHNDVIAALGQQFSENIAIGVEMAASDGSVSPAVQSELITAVNTEITDLESIDTAVEQELDSLASVDATVNEVLDWLSSHQELPLSSCNFDTLISLHAELDEQMESLNGAADQRQADIRKITGNENVGIDHQKLIELLYSDLAMNYPALDDIAEVTDLCANAQSVIRDHIIRKV